LSESSCPAIRARTPKPARVCGKLSPSSAALPSNCPVPSWMSQADRRRLDTIPVVEAVGLAAEPANASRAPACCHGQSDQSTCARLVDPRRSFLGAGASLKYCEQTMPARAWPFTAVIRISKAQRSVPLHAQTLALPSSLVGTDFTRRPGGEHTPRAGRRQ